VKTIKIDKTFINDILESRKGYEIIKTIILMAQGMGIDTIAEGIENFEQLQKLNSLNCTYGQGFYLAMPANAALTEKIFERQSESLAQKLELAAQLDKIKQTAAITS
jgi:EAL domain-containing protein (putative c-di-GMP-specific phosphodiesterase class I)